jgi:hypothetical protein
MPEFFSLTKTNNALFVWALNILWKIFSVFFGATENNDQRKLFLV